MEKRKTLTKELAPFVESIISKKNPDHGVRRFKYRAQKFSGGKYTHLVGDGSSSDVLFDSKFDLWAINSFYSPSSFEGKMALLSQFEAMGLEPYGNDSEAFKLVLEELETAGTMENAPRIIKKFIEWETEIDNEMARKAKVEYKSKFKNETTH